MILLIPCILLMAIPGVVSNTEVVNGTLGNYIYFDQSFSNPELTLQWSFKGTLIAGNSPLLAPICIPSYAGRCQMYNNGTLRLDNLTSADDGTYRFTAVQLPVTTVKDVSYELRVFPILDPPVLSSNGTTNNLIGGSNVSLHCNASGQTVTTYTFYRNGENICSEPHVTCQDSYLYFQPITGSDSGSYTCTIRNPVSTNTSRNPVQLNVTDPVSDVKLTSNIEGLVWPGLDSVSLNCSARGTNVAYTWHLRDEPLPLDSRYHLTENNKVLTIINVTANDNGNFTCIASNSINNLTSNGISFELASKVSAVTLTSNTSGSYIWVAEDSVSLNCSAEGSNVTFLWKLNGKPLPEDSHYHKSEVDSPRHANLIISPVSKTDAGPFTCEASNRLNSENSDALNLSLAWNPGTNISCSAESEGQNIKLGCSWSGGQPKANVSLTFNGKTENGTDSVNKSVNKGDAQGKDLICLGDRLGRTVTCNLPLVPPEVPDHDNTTITDITVGGTVNLTVTLKPGLPATFTWTHTPSSQSKNSIQSREPLVSSTDFSSSYVIRDVTVNDSGKYECKAENAIGTQSFLFTVSVNKNDPSTGLSGGAIAGIVVGVLAGVALIGIAAFFIVKKKKRSGNNKRISEPDDQLGNTVTYATVQKNNGGVAKDNEQEDDVKYAEIKFPNNNSNMATVPPPVETEYSTVKTSIKQ